MRTMAVVFLALLVGTAVILLPLQDAQEEMSRPAYTVGVVLKAMDSEHWLAVRSSMQKAAEENHIRLIVMMPENEAAYGEQDQIIEDLLQEGIDAPSSRRSTSTIRRSEWKRRSSAVSRC